MVGLSPQITMILLSSLPLDSLRMTLCQEVIQVGWVAGLISGAKKETCDCFSHRDQVLGS